MNLNHYYVTALTGNIFMYSIYWVILCVTDVAATAAAKLLQSCSTLCDPIAVEALLKTKYTLQIHAIVEKVSRHDFPLCSTQALILQ